MGWKAIRDHYGIEHIVQVTSAGICIGSGYIHDLIVVANGVRDRSHDNDRFGVRRKEGGELGRIMDEMDADPAKLAELAACADTFDRSLTVYTYDGGAILEKQCEELGWPNVTHDGLIQYENTFSPDRDLVRQWAIKSAKAGVEWRREAVAEAEKKLADVMSSLAQRESDLRQLLDDPA